MYFRGAMAKKFAQLDRFIVLATLGVAPLISACQGSQPQASAQQPVGAANTDAAAARNAVIEIATFKLKQGVGVGEFRPLDKAVETQYAAKQPGFISRESAAGENGEWLV